MSRVKTLTHMILNMNIVHAHTTLNSPDLVWKQTPNPEECTYIHLPSVCLGGVDCGTDRGRTTLATMIGHKVNTCSKPGQLNLSLGPLLELLGKRLPPVGLWILLTTLQSWSWAVNREVRERIPKKANIGESCRKQGNGKKTIPTERWKAKINLSFA